jgi:cell division protein ZapD
MMQLSNIKDIIIYEQPLNEVIRVCLRLEQLFTQIEHHINRPNIFHTRHVISFIINILQLLDRPDLKAKLAKELSHHLTALNRYDNLPDIDKDKLHALTTQLEMLSHHFIDSSGKIGHRLREIELLNTLRTHLASPGGGCNFDIPLYHYWLQQPHEVREATLMDWLNDFSQIKMAANIILDLVRKSAKVEEKQAARGFHQELLDAQANLRMICVAITKDMLAYPEISVGRNFLSVCFLSPNIERHPGQYNGDIPFYLGYCHS